MTVSNNGIIQYVTNRETGIYNTLTGKKIGTSSSHAKLYKDGTNIIWKLSGCSIIKMSENGVIQEQFSIPGNVRQNNNFKTRNITVDRKGNIWISTNSGIIIKTASGWDQMNIVNSDLISNNVKNVIISPANDKWIITDSGICILADTICEKCNEWKILNHKTIGFPCENTKCIAFNQGGDAYIGTYFGLILRYAKGKLDTLPICKPNIFNTMISCLSFDQYQNLWGGTWGGPGLLKISGDGTNFKFYNASNSALGTDNINMVFYSEKDSMIYAGTAGMGIYKIKPTKDSLGNAIESVLVKTKNRVSISNIINIFPNPSPGVFNLTAQNQGTFDLTVSDAFGKTIKTLHNFSIGQKSTLDLSGLSSGMYFLNFTDGSTTSTTKITIQK